MPFFGLKGKFFGSKQKREPSQERVRKGKRALAEQEKRDARAAEISRTQSPAGRAGKEAKGLSATALRSDRSGLLLRPRITEKATDLAERGVYAFDVHQNANKKEIAKAIKDVYSVVPLRVRIVQVPARKVFGRRGRGGTKAGGKKAYVYLKKGDSIEFV